jgi:O-antigen/teichoic acid export membrane protein
MLARLLHRGVTRRLSWAVASFGGLQVIRLGTNVVLARLLAPEIFGAMQIVNAVRTGAELLSDLGIGQNIVASRNGEDPGFVRTAWTLQVLRGAVIAAVLAACSTLIGRSFPIPHLAGLLIVAALVPLLAGLESPARFLLQRSHQLEWVTVLEISGALVGSAMQMTICWFDRSAWSLVYGAAASTLFFSALSYCVAPIPRMRFTLDRHFVWEIVHFGKWIFLSTVLFFIATNFDRFYLGSVLPVAILGIYGVARSLSEMFGMLIGRVGNLVVFPAIAASRLNGQPIDDRVRSYRGKMMILAALALGGFIAISDLVIAVLYDERYAAAARVLPVLLLGVWFAAVNAVGESMLLGCGKPRYGTMSNAVKLAWIAGGLPLAFMHSGFVGMIVVIAAADAVRYLPLAWGQRREGLFFPGQDLAATAVVLASAYGFRQVFHGLGLTGSWMALWT